MAEAIQTSMGNGPSCPWWWGANPSIANLEARGVEEERYIPFSVPYSSLLLQGYREGPMILPWHM
jgi:hypothetical protein